MDAPITKRLIISGLTPSITADDISRRLTTFGTVKAADGFGLADGLGDPRKYGYVTLETTVGKLAKCMNLLSGSTWKGAKLRFGEAKPDFREKIALENKQAAEEPPKKKRKRFGGIEAEDMTLVSPENAVQQSGWKVSSLGRITRPVKMRPTRPITDMLQEKPKPKQPQSKGEKKKKKRAKDPDTRTRRRTIDMTNHISEGDPSKRFKTENAQDLFAPREEEAGFSLLGHLDLDIELDDELPFVAEQAIQQQPYEEHVASLPTSLPTPITVRTHASQAPLVLDPKKALFFPLPSQQDGAMNRARQRDVYDLARDNGWNWRDPAVGFYRTGTEEDIRKRWEDSKGELTRDWKRRHREAGKVNRRKRGGVDGDEY
ncbi:hypothetical protein BDZ97DRAFT_1905505 [Flammula alnicola]|nr:hypothetical protein BDZ97DRAFT_1905505 [Flammula alnicola]